MKHYKMDIAEIYIFLISLFDNLNFYNLMTKFDVNEFFREQKIECISSGCYKIIIDQTAFIFVFLIFHISFSDKRINIFSSFYKYNLINSCISEICLSCFIKIQ